MHSEHEFLKEVREMTGNTSDLALSDDGLKSALASAKRKISIAKGLDAEHNWFGPNSSQAEKDALFWFTCLFTKIETGELDAQDLDAGAISEDTLTATNDGDYTQWYSNAVSAMRSFNPSDVFVSRSASRRGRDYKTDTYQPEASTGTSSNSTDVSSDDI